jgi:glycosyltransferase involved in cell wall biosynthesis
MDMSEDRVDVIMRTKNSAEMLKQSLDSIFQEIPVRKVIIVDGGSTDDTIKIASQYENVEIYHKPELNLGQATQFGFRVAETEWIAVIDSDIILKNGWYSQMSEYMNESDAVEGSRIDYYRVKWVQDLTKVKYGVFGQTLIRRKHLENLNLDLQQGEDAAIKYYFDQNGLRWKKVANYLAEHYPFETNIHKRTGTIISLIPRYIPKKQQIEQGHIYRKYKMMTLKEVLWKTFIQNIAKEAYVAFRTRIWFVLAYLGLI